MPVIPPLDEAELKVMIRNVYNKGGAKEVLVMAKEIMYCLQLVLKTLSECIEAEGK